MNEVSYLYSMRKKRNADEIHIFKSNKDFMEKCIINDYSFCELLRKQDCDNLNLNCLTEYQARTECVKLRRSVCAKCIEDLYRTI